MSAQAVSSPPDPLEFPTLFPAHVVAEAAISRHAEYSRRYHRLAEFLRRPSVQRVLADHLDDRDYQDFDNLREDLLRR